MRLFLLLMIACLSITACGQKGPLYKSPPTEETQPKSDDAPAQADARA